MIGVIGLVGKQVTRPRQMAGEHDRALDVGGLAGGEIEGQGPALFVAQGMDLGVSAAFGAADGLSRSPPFPPPEYGPSTTVYNRYNRWSGRGHWQYLFRALTETLAGTPEQVSIDITHVKAHRRAGGVRRYSVSCLIVLTRSNIRSDATAAYARYAAGCGGRRNQSPSSPNDSIQT